ncbi:MAG: hypothetical protein AB7Y46_00720 [Armatimonadota bacterium]
MYEEAAHESAASLCYPTEHSGGPTGPRCQLLLCAGAIEAFVTLALIGGCARQAEEPQVVQPPPNVAAQSPDLEEPQAAAPSGGEHTLGQVMATIKRPTSFVMIVVRSEGTDAPPPGARITMRMDGDKLAQMRTEDENGQRVMIVDLIEDVVYIYDTSTNQGLRLPSDEQRPTEAPDPYEAYKPELRILGSEEIERIDCWVVETASGQSEGKMWVGKQDGLMRQIQSPELTAVYRYTQINSVPDSAFEVPPGITMSEMGAMGMEGGGGE